MLFNDLPSRTRLLSIHLSNACTLIFDIAVSLQTHPTGLNDPEKKKKPFENKV